MYDEKTLYGSGSLIKSRCVLTAAHNLYPKSFKREPDQFYLFIPALHGRYCPYGNIKIEDLKSMHY
jgi:V8-like Glu-specific endopeptidase